MNTPIQEKLEQLSRRLDELEQLKWGSEEANQIKAELIQAKIDLMLAYPEIREKLNAKHKQD